MPRKCSIYGCSSGYTSEHQAKKVSMYKFPEDEEECRQWVTCLPNKIEKVTKFMGICALHWPSDTPLARKKRGRYPTPTVPPSIFPNVPASIQIEYNITELGLYNQVTEPTTFTEQDDSQDASDDQLIEIDGDDTSFKYSPHDSPRLISPNGLVSSPERTPSPANTQSTRIKVMKRENDDAQETDLPRVARRELSRPAFTNKDELDFFGIFVTHALRDMPRDQMIHAKKLISEVIYEGQLNNLSRASTVNAMSSVTVNPNIAGPSGVFTSSE